MKKYDQNFIFLLLLFFPLRSIFGFNNKFIIRNPQVCPHLAFIDEWNDKMDMRRNGVDEVKSIRHDLTNSEQVSGHLNLLETVSGNIYDGNLFIATSSVRLLQAQLSSRPAYLMTGFKPCKQFFMLKIREANETFLNSLGFVIPGLRPDSTWEYLQLVIQEKPDSFYATCTVTVQQYTINSIGDCNQFKMPTPVCGTYRCDERQKILAEFDDIFMKHVLYIDTNEDVQNTDGSHVQNPFENNRPSSSGDSATIFIIIFVISVTLVIVTIGGCGIHHIVTSRKRKVAKRRTPQGHSESLTFEHGGARPDTQTPLAYN